MLATAKEEYRDDFAIMKPAVGHTELVLDNINGTVSIAGVDGLQQVEITGVKIAKASTIGSAKEEVARISINVDDSGPALRVKTEQPNGSLGVSYTVNYDPGAAWLENHRQECQWRRESSSHSQFCRGHDREWSARRGGYRG
jgi:hypothetical protein